MKKDELALEIKSKINILNTKHNMDLHFEYVSPYAHIVYDKVKTNQLCNNTDVSKTIECLTKLIKDKEVDN